MAGDSGTEEKAAPQKRGEAAWKAEKDRIAERNQQAKKAGKEQRQAHERRQSEERHSADAADLATLKGKTGGK